MHPDTLLIWPKEKERQPFDTAAWNRFVNFMNGTHVAIARWRTDDQTIGLEWLPQLPLLRTQVETEIQLAKNGYQPNTRAGLRVGARAGSQATKDAAILIESELDGAGWRFKHGLLFGANFTAIDAATGTLIGAEALTAGLGIDFGLVTFVVASPMLRLPGLSGRTGFVALSISGTTGPRLRGDFANNTQVSRTLFQTGDAESTSIPGVGVIPSASGAKAGWIAYADDNADATHLIAMLANATDSTVDIVTSKTGAGVTRDIRLLADVATVLTEVARVGAVDLDLRLANTRWLSARNAGNTVTVTLMRLSATDIIEVGAVGQRMQILSSLANDTYLSGRNVANTGGFNLIGVTTSDRIAIGDITASMVLLSPLANANYLNGRNAANSANINLIRVSGADEIEVGQAGVTLKLLGTVVLPTGSALVVASLTIANNSAVFGRNAANTASLPLIGIGTDDRVKLSQTGQSADLLGTVRADAIDPPTEDGQVTRESQAKGWVEFDSAGTISQSYNVTSVTRLGAGEYTVAWNRDFAAATYALTAAYGDAGGPLIWRFNAKTAADCTIKFETVPGVASDPDWGSVCAFGALS